MTLAEAKDFYFAYKGYSFHMGREEPSRYNEFKKVCPDKSVLKEWDEELLEGLFKDLSSDQEHAWIAHGHILKIAFRGNCDAGLWGERLLREMEHMDSLDAKNRILITENMAGRTEKLTDGGVFFFCRYTGLEKEMHRIMLRLLDIPVYPDEFEGEQPGWADPQERYQRAKSSYLQAYAGFRRC